MRQVDKTLQFKKAVGTIIRELRKEEPKRSINKFAHEYDLDRGNLSKIERGIYSIQLITAWRIAEALGIKFSDFAKMLEDKLGDDFVLMDE